jgi:hypothetical protein
MKVNESIVMGKCDRKACLQKNLEQQEQKFVNDETESASQANVRDIYSQ